MIPIDVYDGFEHEANSTQPNSIQMAFTPSTFLELNCPVRVDHEGEFVRFIDSMHEFSAGDFFQRPFPLSPDEGDLIRRIGDHVADYSAKAFGRSIRPWVAPLSALEMFRVVTATAERLGKKSLTVLEIGPGSGYLGALLHLAGHRHISMDNTQAYYLWQNRLFSSLAGDGFAELADPVQPLADDPAKTMVHLPWWRFVQLHETLPFKVDVVICDHALNEISATALRYILRVAHGMLAQVENGVFLFCYPGHAQKRNEAQLFREFDRTGYQILFKRLFYGLGLKGGGLAPLAITVKEATSINRLVRAWVKIRRHRLRSRYPQLLSLDSQVPRYNPSGRQGTISPAEAVPIRREEQPPDYIFVRATGAFVPPFID